MKNTILQFYTLKFYFRNLRLHETLKKLVLENYYKTVVPLFGAAYAAPNKGSTIVY